MLIRFFLPIFFCYSAILLNQCTPPESESNLIGNWAFSLPDGNPAWLSIKEDSTARMLWSVGSAKPIEIGFPEHNKFELTGKLRWRPFGSPDWFKITNPVTGKLNEEGNIVLTVTHTFAEKVETFQLTGKKMPPIPPKPVLSDLNFGETVDLLANGLQGWKLTNGDKINGWSLKDKVLVNETPKTDFGAYGNYGNLRTIEDFEDFELRIDYNVPEGGNSGIYLRGAYEVQVVDRDSPMQGIQGPGAVFGRIIPQFNHANPGGEWNSYRLILVNRHITIELNGKTVIDNQPLEGCTGGGINADDTSPGPIFLQGDHTSVKYRNIFLRKITNSLMGT